MENIAKTIFIEQEREVLEEVLLNACCPSWSARFVQTRSS